MLDISIQQRIVYFFIIRGTETRPGEMFTDSKRVSALYKYQGLQAVYWCSDIRKWEEKIVRSEL